MLPHGAAGSSAAWIEYPLAALQFVPFIQGPRNCLGQYFALLEARVVLSLLCKVWGMLAAGPGVWPAN